MSHRLYDAHNHFQDARLGDRPAELMAACHEAGVVRMVVNGVGEADWSRVRALARQFPAVLPSFGYHPWFIQERTPDWFAALTHFLNTAPSAIGEIGLDRWKPGLAYDGQEAVFTAQLGLAAERNLPASLHCLQAWGRLLELLQAGPVPARGFLLHSYGGPVEMVKSFAELGAYFSLPGDFAQARKERRREAFRQVPADRLLIETDAPDQRLPEDRNRFPLTDLATGKPVNHPANLTAVYEFAAELRRVPVATLAVQVEQNFLRLFGGL